MNGRTRPGAAALRGTVAAVLLGALFATPGCSVLESRMPGASSGTAVQSAPGAAAPQDKGIVGGQGAPSAGEAQFGGTAPSAPGAGTGTRSSGPSAASQEQMIIRNANMRLEVAETTATIEKIRTLTKKYSGVVSNVLVSNDQGTPPPQPLAEGDTKSSTRSSGQPYNGTMTVLVPVTKFEAFTDEVRKMGKLLSFATDDQNVTQQHLDMQARLLNLRAEAARLRSFFASARTVRDMLAIEEQLARVQGEIESLQAQLTYLERQAAMATLTVELVEPATLVRPAGVDWGLGTAITTAIRAFVGTINVIIIFIGAVLPLAIIGAGIYFLIRWIVVRRRGTGQETEPGADEDSEEAAPE